MNHQCFPLVCEVINTFTEYVINYQCSPFRMSYQHFYMCDKLSIFSFYDDLSTRSLVWWIINASIFVTSVQHLYMWWIIKAFLSWWVFNTFTCVMNYQSFSSLVSYQHFYICDESSMLLFFGDINTWLCGELPIIPSQ